MNVYAIGLKWDNSLKTKQPLIIRLIDLDDNNKIIDVTRKQLVQAIKNNKIKVNNIELNKYNRLKGTEYSIGLIPDLEKESDKYSALILNKVDGIYTLANYLGQTIQTPSLNTVDLRNTKILNIQTNKNIEKTVSIVDEINVDTPIRQQNKYKLLLSGSKYSYLLQEPYINNIDILFKITKQLELGTNTKLKLNIDNYFNFENNKLDKLQLKNSFIALSNLITTIYKNDKTLFIEGFDNKFSVVEGYKIVYHDDYCRICILKYKDVTDEGFNKWDPIKTLEIVINNKPVFRTAYKISDISNLTFFNKLYNLSKIKPKRERSITKYIQVGDKLSRDGYLSLKLFTDNNIQIPSELHNEIRETVLEDWTVLAEIKSQIGTRNILIFDVVEQLLIEITEAIELAYALPSSNLSDVTDKALRIKSIIGLERINELDKRYIEQLTSAYKDKHISNVLEYKAMSADKKKELLSNRNNYDLDGNKQIAEIANIVYREIGDKNTDDIALKENTINMILETDFFSKKTVKSGSKLLDFYRNSEQKTYELSDSSAKITEVFANMKNDIGKTTSIIHNSSNNKVYVCDKKLKTIIHILYILGYGLNNRKAESKPLNKITNENINIQNFLICDTLLSEKLQNTGYKVHTAFDRCNCDAYIISEWYDTDFKTILRFKRYKDARDYLFSTIKNEWVVSDFNEFHSNQNQEELAYLSISYSSEEVIEGMFIRDIIMKGIPNNFPYIYDNADFFNKLAKQPK